MRSSALDTHDGRPAHGDLTQAPAEGLTASSGTVAVGGRRATDDPGDARASGDAGPAGDDLLPTTTMQGIGAVAAEVLAEAAEAAPEPGPALPEGAVLGGDFRIVRVIARGGMGTVYEALQLGTGRRRAVKVLHHREPVTDPVVSPGLAEARVRAQVDSEHVVDVVVAGVDPATGARWIAMEFLEGETLADRLLRLAPGEVVPAEEAWRVLAQLGRGLAQAHRQGVVHRDLKPANVFLVRRASEPVTVKLLDFGLAHVMGRGEGDRSPRGTPLWMAPEQVKGGEITPATDVWAVGLLAFWLFTGRSYWLHAGNPAGALGDLLDEVTTEPLVSATARAAAIGFAGELPDGLDGWFARCVARDPASRFATAREMSAALGEIIPTSPSWSVIDDSGARPRLTQRTAAASRGTAGTAPPDVRPSAPSLPPGEAPARGSFPRVETAVARPRPSPHRRSSPPELWELPPPAPPAPAAPPRDRAGQIALVCLLVFALVAVSVYALRASRAPAASSSTGVVPVGVAIAGPPPWPSRAPRRWSGSLFSPAGTVPFELLLRLGADASVAGHLAWTPAPGDRRVVRVTGTYEPTLGHLDVATAPGEASPLRLQRLRVLSDGHVIGADARDETIRLDGAPALPPAE